MLCSICGGIFLSTPALEPSAVVCEIIPDVISAGRSRRLLACPGRQTFLFLLVGAVLATEFQGVN
jgi:hypothetical protein